jgi:hypothetical protein
MFADGNVYEGNESISTNNRAGIIFKQGKNANGVEPKGDAATCLVSQPFKVAPVTTEKADLAYQRVLESAGAILPKRDAVDQRIIKSVQERTGGLVNSPAAVGGWPQLQSAPAPTDSDHDGMPDDWEQSHKLNANDPSDGKAIATSGYSNLEEYLNDLAAKPGR